MTIDSSKGIAGLKGALRYVRAYRDQVFVVKLGGDVVGDPEVLDQVAAQLALLSSLGIRLVVVHGGGPQATALSRGSAPSRRSSRAGGSPTTGARGRQDGVRRPAQHRPAGRAPGAPGAGGRAVGRGCRSDHGAPPAAGDGGGRCRQEADGGLRPRRRHRPGRSAGAGHADGGALRAGRREPGRATTTARSTTSTPTRWPSRSRWRCGRRS